MEDGEVAAFQMGKGGQYSPLPGIPTPAYNPPKKLIFADDYAIFTRFTLSKITSVPPCPTFSFERRHWEGVWMEETLWSTVAKCSNCRKMS